MSKESTDVCRFSAHQLPVRKADHCNQVCVQKNRSLYDQLLYDPSLDGRFSVDTIIASFDTRPFDDLIEFINYRNVMHNEHCVKVTADLERVKAKATSQTKGYIGKDLPRKILLSILMGYRSGLYKIPALDGLKQAEIVKVVNSWGISEITISDWKNCSRTKRQECMLPREVVEETLQKIISM